MGYATSRHMALALGIEDTEKPDTLDSPVRGGVLRDRR